MKSGTLRCTQVLYRFSLDSDSIYIETGFRSCQESDRVWVEYTLMNSFQTQSTPAFSLDFGLLWIQSGLGPLWMLPGVPPKNSSTDRTAHRCRDRLSNFSARCHSDSFSVDVAVCPWLQWCSLPALFSFSLYASASFSQAISLRWIITLGTAKIMTELIWRRRIPVHQRQYSQRKCQYEYLMMTRIN